jgi:hypothetical protein
MEAIGRRMQYGDKCLSKEGLDEGNLCEYTKAHGFFYFDGLYRAQNGKFFRSMSGIILLFHSLLLPSSSPLLLRFLFSLLTPLPRQHCKH